MLRLETEDGWWLITHVDHAHLAGAFAAKWGNDLFRSPEPRANVLKGIPGVESVDNQIEVLPNSPNDDRIRASVYNRIYTQPSLRKYNANQGSVAQAMGPGGRSVALMAGGITNNPPLGYHAIHIIVKNGNVTLYGAVLNDMDSAIAEVQANTAPGAFQINNNLVIEGSTSKPASK